MDTQHDHSVTPSTIGAVLHGAARYDLLVWLLTLGRERVFGSSWSAWRALNPATPSWMWAAGREPWRSLPNGVWGRRAQCMGSTRRRR